MATSALPDLAPGAHQVAAGSQAMASAVGSAVVANANAVGAVFEGAADAVADGATNAARAVGAVFEGAADAVADGATNAARAVGAVFEGAGDAVADGATNAAHAAGAALAGAGDAVANGVTGAANAVAAEAVHVGGLINESNARVVDAANQAGGRMLDGLNSVPDAINASNAQVAQFFNQQGEAVGNFVVPAAGQVKLFFDSAGNEIGHAAVSAAGAVQVFFDGAGQQITAGANSAGQAIVSVAAPAAEQTKVFFDDLGRQIGSAVLPAAGQVKDFFDAAGAHIGHALAPAAGVFNAVPGLVTSAAEFSVDVDGTGVLVLPVVAGAVALAAAALAISKVRAVLHARRLQQEEGRHLSDRLDWLLEVMITAAKTKGFAKTQATALFKVARFLDEATKELDAATHAAAAGRQTCCAPGAKDKAFALTLRRLERGLNENTKALRAAVVLFARTHPADPGLAQLQAVLPKPLGFVGDRANEKFWHADGKFTNAYNLEISRLGVLSHAELVAECEMRGLNGRAKAEETLRQRLREDIFGTAEYMEPPKIDNWGRCWAAFTC